MSSLLITVNVLQITTTTTTTTTITTTTTVVIIVIIGGDGVSSSSSSSSCSRTHWPSTDPVLNLLDITSKFYTGTMLVIVNL